MDFLFSLSGKKGVYVEEPSEITNKSKEKLIAILNLWNKLSLGWRNSSGGRLICTGILAEEVGLIVNDTIIREAVVGSSKEMPTTSTRLFVLAGIRKGIFEVVLLSNGISIHQAVKKRKLLSVHKEEIQYYTYTSNAVIESIKFLNYLWPNMEFTFVYGINYAERKSTFQKWFLTRPKDSLTESIDYYDGFVLQKTRPLNTDINRSEYLWDTGEIYSADTPINKPFEPRLIKIEQSQL